ncbi:MAG: hypothetical protein RLZ98_1681 [Pseudomonadota bacterium]|jgi:chromate reductase
MAEPQYRLLGLSGSLRRHSYSTAVLDTLTASLPADIAVATFDIASLPHYNEDLDEGEGPAPVAAFKAAVRASHGLLIVSPEYNHSIPGVLKNAIDWGSRPGYRSCFANKPVSFITTGAGGLGGVRAQAHFHEIFLSMACRIVPGKQVVIGGAQNKVKDGRLIDETTRLFALAKIDELLAEIALLQGWEPRRDKIGSQAR